MRQSHRVKISTIAAFGEGTDRMSNGGHIGFCPNDARRRAQELISFMSRAAKSSQHHGLDVSEPGHGTCGGWYHGDGSGGQTISGGISIASGRSGIVGATGTQGS
jgi:hypothetical protein